jgi:hypothetical protein
MAVFDRAIATALRLINKYGQIVEWKQLQEGVPANPDTPWIGGEPTTAIYSPVICILPLDKEGSEFLRQLGGTEALTGNMYGLMGQIGFDPLIGQNTIKTLHDNKILTINTIDLLSPNGQKVLYTINITG